jgi:excisionase family DNA binding protein
MIAPTPVEPICVKINDAACMIGVGRTKLYELIATNQIEVVKLGNSTRVTTASLRALIAQQCPKAFPSE